MSILDTIKDKFTSGERRPRASKAVLTARSATLSPRERRDLAERRERNRALRSDAPIQLPQVRPVELPSIEERKQAHAIYSVQFRALFNQIARRERFDADGFEAVIAHEHSRLRIPSQNLDDLAYASRAGDLLLAKGHCLHEDQLSNAMRLAVKLSQNPNSHIAVDAPTQYGKTMILIMGILLHNLHNYRRGITNRACILVNPSRNSPNEQSERDFSAARLLHANLALGDEFMSLHNQTRDQHWQDCMKRARAEHIHEVIKNCHAIGITHLTLAVDEADEASGHRSVLAKWARSLTAAGIEVRLVLCSATAYQYKDMSEFVKLTVAVPPNSKYCGLVEGQRVPVLSLSDAAALTGLTKDFAGFNLNKHGKTRRKAVSTMIEQFITGVSGAPGLNGKPLNGGDHLVLRYGSSATMESMLTYLQPMLRRHGISIVRFFGDTLNRVVKNAAGEPVILRTVEEHIAHVGGRCLIAVIGNGRRADRFPTNCTVFFDFTERFSDMASAEQGTLGRMTGHGKITDERNVIAIVSDDNAEMVQLFRDNYDYNGTKVAVKPVKRAHRFTEVKVQARERDYVRFAPSDFRGDDRDFVQAMFDAFAAEIEPGLRHYGKFDPEAGRVRGKLEHQPPGQEKHAIEFFRIINRLPGGLDKLEEILTRHYGDSVRLLMPGTEAAPEKRRADGKYLPVMRDARSTDDHLIHISVRTQSATGHDSGNLTRRYYTEDKDDEGKRRVRKGADGNPDELQTAFLWNYQLNDDPALPEKTNRYLSGTGELRQVIFHLARDIDSRRLYSAQSVNSLPDHLCYYAEFLSPADWAIINNAPKVQKRYGRASGSRTVHTNGTTLYV